MPMRIMLADDHPQVRSALRLALEQDPDLTVVAEAGCAQTVREQLPHARIDLLMIDWGLPGLASDDLISWIKCQNSHVRILALSGRPEAGAEALSAGVDSFVSKGDPPECLFSAVRDLRCRL
ncbi:MAG TPA: response regulator transcription factor [Symbiobacteriaceae bacterium]|nr:response regulator transcription factor [Symbiobacteriaceae bacterium]